MYLTDGSSRQQAGTVTYLFAPAPAPTGATAEPAAAVPAGDAEPEAPAAEGLLAFLADFRAAGRPGSEPSPQTPVTPAVVPSADAWPEPTSHLQTAEGSEQWDDDPYRGSDVQVGPGWWQASDGRWYAPEMHPDFQGQAAARERAAGPVSSPPGSSAAGPVSSPAGTSAAGSSAQAVADDRRPAAGIFTFWRSGGAPASA